MSFLQTLCQKNQVIIFTGDFLNIFWLHVFNGIVKKDMYIARQILKIGFKIKYILNRISELKLQINLSTNKILLCSLSLYSMFYGIYWGLFTFITQNSRRRERRTSVHTHTHTHTHIHISSRMGDTITPVPKTTYSMSRLLNISTLIPVCVCVCVCTVHLCGQKTIFFMSHAFDTSKIIQ